MGKQTCKLACLSHPQVRQKLDITDKQTVMASESVQSTALSADTIDRPDQTVQRKYWSNLCCLLDPEQMRFSFKR